MAKKVDKKNLGMGIRALLTNIDEEVALDQEKVVKELAHSVAMIPIEEIEVNPFQPRNEFDQEALEELADSLRVHGLIQPITVRRLAPNAYQLISGERRLRASKLAGLTEVPAYIRIANDQEMLEMALIENIQREDLNPLEQARGLQRLVDDFGLTHERAAQAIGRSRSAATNLLRLLQLAQPVQAMLMAGDLEMGHARALLALEPAQQILAAAEVASRKLSVRETEKFVAITLKPGRQQPLLRMKADKPRDLQRLEEQLADRLAAAVDIRIKRRTRRGESGEVAIAFGSLEELNGLLERLGARDA